MLAAAERLATASAGTVVCVSDSLRQRYLELRLAPAAKTIALEPGSSNGVDVERFRPAAPGEAAALRRQLGIPAAAPVVGFVGRLTRDKGVADLVEAFFGTVIEQHPEARLLLVGDHEQGDELSAQVHERLGDPRVVLTGFVNDTGGFYRAMNVLALPSYREGFPNTPLEAAASAVPVVGYAATGTVDAVVHGESGSLVPVGDRQALAAALVTEIADPGTAMRHGRAGRERVLQSFTRERVWQAWADIYRAAAAGPAPSCDGAGRSPRGSDQ
jgi:glycosyltransferase involved in cell wall biosynthesis